MPTSRLGVLHQALNRRKDSLAQMYFPQPKPFRVAPRKGPSRDAVGSGLTQTQETSDRELEDKLRSNSKTADGKSRVLLNSSPLE